MSWIQILVIAFGNVAWMLPVFFWVRSESRADARHFENETKELRRELIDVMRSIDAEMRDFHGRLERQDAEFRMRLCAIEERRGK